MILPSNSLCFNMEPEIVVFPLNLAEITKAAALVILLYVQACSSSGPTRHQNTQMIHSTTSINCLTTRSSTTRSSTTRSTECRTANSIKIT